jgi:hypothetical protein
VESERPAPSLKIRLRIVGAIGALLAAAAIHWAAAGERPARGAGYIALGIVLVAATAGAHLLAVRHHERPALEGLAWVLTVVAGVAIGAGAYAELTGWDGR